MSKNSSIEIIPVKTRRDMRAFLQFNLDLYKDCPYSVPELNMDVRFALNPKKHPAFEFCEAQPYLAKRDGKVVGRFVALINHRANETWNRKEVRFSWIDFIEDYEVCKALLDTCVQWGKERWMNCIQGPLGFTDQDREGALTWGFDQHMTMSMIYNYPYYIDYYKRYGLDTAAAWVESIVYIPETLPEKYVRASKIVSERYNVHLKKFTSHRKLMKIGTYDIFKIINESYSHLHGYSQLTDKQIKAVSEKYIPFVKLKYLPMIYNEKDELVGCFLMLPSIAKEMKKANGRLFPFGWWHLLKGLYFNHSDLMEFLLVAIKPEYQNKGINALMIVDMFENMTADGFKRCETNAELVDNPGVQAFTDSFKREITRRREAFEKQF